MKRHVAWLLSCGLLVGCASTPPPIDEPSAHPHTTTPTAQPGSAAAADSTSAGGASPNSTTPAAFHFKSGTLEIGDFDPYALGDNIFDPCTEISPEEFAAAGFENVEPIPEEYAGLARGLSACEVRDGEQRIYLTFMNNNADRFFIEETTELLPLKVGEPLAAAFAYGPKGGGGEDCYVQVDTERGGIVAISPDLHDSSGQTQNCARAFSALQSLYSSTNRVS